MSSSRPSLLTWSLSPRWVHLRRRTQSQQAIRRQAPFLTTALDVPAGRRRRVQPDPLPGLLLLQPHAALQRLQVG